MNNSVVLNRVSNLAILVPVIVSLFVTTGINIDPVNLPKMVVLVVSAGYLLGLLISNRFKGFFENRIVASALVIFILGILISTIFSKSPITQTWYGSYARNTGVLTYVALVIIFIANFIINKVNFFNKMIFGLFFAGMLNVIYGLFQIAGLDFVDWNNNFNAIIGTFGNPNFSSAFISISLITYPFIYSNAKKPILRIILVLSFLLSIYAILKTNSQQGYFLFLLGLAVLSIVYLFKKNVSIIFKILPFGALVIGGFFTLLGFLQKGPLANFLYQPSISLRGFYWNAGNSMFKSSPFYGIGLDSYGDNYLRNRSAAAILPPGGENVFSNAAHNVFIDIAASGGLLMILPYLALMIYALVLVIRVITSRDFNLSYLTLAAIWLALQLESVISINQIGLAVWIWCATGALIAYSFILLGYRTEATEISSKKKTQIQETNASTFLISLATTLVFAFGVFPEQVADMNFKSAMAAQNVEKIQKVINSFPKSSERMSRTSQIFLRNTLNDQALEISLNAVKLNPDHLNSWITLVSNPNASVQQRQWAKDNLIRLDPRSSEWRKIVIK